MMTSFFRPDDVEVPVGVEAPEVAGAQPPSCQVSAVASGLS